MKIFVALCLICVPASVWGYCNQYAIANCMDGTGFEKYKGSKDQQLFISHSKEELTQLCHDFKSVSACWNRNSDGCQQAIRGLFEGLQDAFHYMCGEGFEKFMRNQQCLGTDSLKNDAKKCQDTMNREVARFKSEAAYKDQDELKTEACGYIDEAKKCINDYVVAVCGKDAADFENTFMNKMLKPLMSIVNCGGLNRIQIILIAGGCVLGVVLLSVCLVMIARSRRAANNTSKMESGSGFTNPIANQAPPPYKQFK